LYSKGKPALPPVLSVARPTLQLLLVPQRPACENSSVTCPLAASLAAPLPVLLGATGFCAGGGVFSWAAVAPSAQLFGPTIRRTGDPSVIALTFDDGPNPAVTPHLLDLLERHAATSTFFLIGERVRAFPALANEILRRGHTVGNHTDTHRRLVFLSTRGIADQLTRCAEALTNAIGLRTRWMRPPFGYRGPQLESALRKQAPDSRVVMWSASARDWNAQPSRNVVRRLGSVRGGDIVLLHDGDHRNPSAGRTHTLDALEYWLPRWKDGGLRLLGLNDLPGLA
jgi:peptidoglycan-N-acetylglucosamine deacetylase